MKETLKELRWLVTNGYVELQVKDHELRLGHLLNIIDGVFELIKEKEEDAVESYEKIKDQNSFGAGMETGVITACRELREEIKDL